MRDTNESHVLLVDENELILQAGAALLHRGGYKVSTERCCEHALDAIKDGRTNLVIIDYWFGPNRMTGLEFIQKVRQAGCRIPILAITGNEAAPGGALTEAGANAFIRKPLKNPPLLEVVRGLLAEAGEAKRA